MTATLPLRSSRPGTTTPSGSVDPLSLGPGTGGENSTGLEYLEIADLTHLLRMRRRERPEDSDPHWRESYYFHLSDPVSGTCLITTIGAVPNRGRTDGFVLVLRKGRIRHARLLTSWKIRWQETDRFRLGPLQYAVDGIDWRLTYRSDACSFDVLFRPINPLFRYNKGPGPESLGPFSRLATQHLEQAGTYEGSMRIRGDHLPLGPASGHRDHSWGIRDWQAIDSYWLLCCGFGPGRAINVWQGRKDGQIFLAGYVYDSVRNREVVSCSVEPRFAADGMEPVGGSLLLRDDADETHRIDVEILSSVPVPLRPCIDWQTQARVTWNGRTGWGLFERLLRDRNPVHKLRALAQGWARREHA